MPNLKYIRKMPHFTILLNILYKGNQIGVAIRALNFPGKPQCEEQDFLMSQHSFASSLGDVLMLYNFPKIPFLGRRSGGGSWAFSKEDFEAFFF